MNWRVVAHLNYLHLVSVSLTCCVHVPLERVPGNDPRGDVMTPYVPSAVDSSVQSRPPESCLLYARRVPAVALAVCGRTCCLPTARYRSLCCHECFMSPRPERTSVGPPVVAFVRRAAGRVCAGFLGADRQLIQVVCQLAPRLTDPLRPPVMRWRLSFLLRRFSGRVAFLSCFTWSHRRCYVCYRVTLKPRPE